MPPPVFTNPASDPHLRPALLYIYDEPANNYRAMTPSDLNGVGASANDSTQTSASGATYVQLAGHACRRIHLLNSTGVDIEVLQDGGGVPVTVFNGTYFTFAGIANSSQISIRRADQSNTQVTAKWRWES